MRTAAMTTATMAVLGGCDFLDGLIDVDAPSQIEAEAFELPGNASRMLDGAVGDFECAFAHYSLFMGTFNDELAWARGSEAWRAIDSRTLQEAGFDAPHATSTCDVLHQGEVPGVYQTLSTARFQADQLLRLLDEWGPAVPNAGPIRATAAAYSGYSHLLLGESMCTAAFDLGPELEPSDIFVRARDRFTTAIEGGGASRDILNLALVGRARTHLNRGDLEAAKADAERVDAGFVSRAGFSDVAPRRENRVYVATIRGELVTVPARFPAQDDPRVPLERTERQGSATGHPIWLQRKYTSAATPIRLASWVEARLIVAEAELAAGNRTAAVAAINQVRTRPSVELPAFESSDADEIQAQLLRERTAEFFLESQRQSDIRRLNLPLDPPAGTVYPAGGSYGGQRCLPLPLNERINNPNI